MFKIKEEIVFVGVDVNETEHVFKSEPDDIDIHYHGFSRENSDDNISDKASLDGHNHDDDLKRHVGENNISKDNDHNSSEKLVLISQIKIEPGDINYEYLEENLDTVATPKSPKKTKKRPWKGEMSDDEDYVPPTNLKTPKPKQTATVSQDQTAAVSENQTATISEDQTATVLEEKQIAVELENYKRSTRIGCCIFDDCIEDCISLIPRRVRCNMAIEHNIYIPFLSKVCKEHLQDQNWEEISSTTTLFRADHCQDLKNIVTEAATTNLNFENIDTVDSKLVRYWFDVNKGDFNRIFNSFPKLKRLKESKTAFAVYLMHLQKTSIKRIGLLLKMKEKAVKRRIMFVKDVVKCSTFKSFKQKFLEDD